MATPSNAPRAAAHSPRHGELASTPRHGVGRRTHTGTTSRRLTSPSPRRPWSMMLEALSSPEVEQTVFATDLPLIRRSCPRRSSPSPSRSTAWPSSSTTTTSTSGSLPAGESRCSTSSRCAGCSAIRCDGSSSSSCWPPTPTWPAGAPGSPPAGVAQAAVQRASTPCSWPACSKPSASGADRRAAPPRRPGAVPHWRVPRPHGQHAARSADGGSALLRSAGLETTGPAPGDVATLELSSCSAAAGTGWPPACRRRPAARSKSSPRSPSSSPTPGASSTPSPTSTSSPLRERWFGRPAA